MATALFQKRSEADYGTAITKYNSQTCGEEEKMLYLVSRRPGVYYEKYQGTEEWETALGKMNISPDAPREKQIMAAAEELTWRIMGDGEMLGKIADDIEGKIKGNPERTFTSVRVACPYPVDDKETGNVFAPALAASVAYLMEEKLDGLLQERGVNIHLDVVGELDPQKSSHDQAILNIVNNERATTSSPEEGKEVDLYMQRLIRQPVYSGPVDPDALYVPVDDFLVSQSTMTGLMNYIQANSGVTTSPVTGFKLFNGVDVLEPQQATLDLLNLAIDGKPHEVAAAGGKEAFQGKINETLGEVGLHIDFDHVSKTNLSNAELLFVAGYFADGENPAHQASLSRALEAVGGSVEEARGNSAHDIFNSPPGSIEGLKQISRDTLQHRTMMEAPESTRYQELVRSGNVTHAMGAER